MARELSLIISHSTCSTCILISCFLGLLWGWEVLGCTPISPVFASPRNKATALSQQQRHLDGFIDGVIPHIWSSEALERYPTVAADSRRDRAAVFSTQGWREATITRGIDIRSAHQLPGKADGCALLWRPFDKLSQWRCSHPQISTITSWGLGTGM